MAAQDGSGPEFGLESSSFICFPSLAIYQAVGDADGLPHYCLVKAAVTPGGMFLSRKIFSICAMLSCTVCFISAWVH